ncbi:MAG: ATP-binding protein [Firmicutes bacterium]|jgi:PAS domain S-box-containing protein|nr:ATP-binding protein [Bacillota bacterium]
MRDSLVPPWTFPAGVLTITAARFAVGHITGGVVGWWVIPVDLAILSLVALVMMRCTAYAARREREAKAALARLEGLEMVSKGLIETESVLRDDLIRGHRGLNERVVRLSGLLEASKELVATRNLHEVLTRITNLACGVVGARGAVLRIQDRDRERVVTSGNPRAVNDPEFELSAQVVVGGQPIGALTVHFSKIGSDATDNAHLLSIIASYASVAIENAQLYRNLSSTNTQLELSKRYAERLIEEAPVGIAVLGPDHRVVTFNREMCQVMRMSKEDAIGRSVQEILGAEPYDLVRAVQVHAQGSTGTGATEIRSCDVVDASGGTHILRLVVSTTQSMQGYGLATVIMAEDVTEKVRLGEQLRQAEKLKVVGEFAAGMAHEINNPIGIISACAEVIGKKLARHGPEFAECVKTAKIIEDEATRCSLIVRSVLTFARQAELNLGRIDLAGLLRETAEFLRARANSSNVSLELDLPVETPDIVGDKNQLKQVFLNISLNAIEAMKEGGTLSISARCVGDEQGGSVEILFSDTGPGIPPEHADRVFNPFFTTKSGGTGLGLPLSLGIVENHGGRIVVEPSSGTGATFRVVLPLTAAGWRPPIAAKVETVSPGCAKTAQPVRAS